MMTKKRKIECCSNGGSKNKEIKRHVPDDIQNQEFPMPVDTYVIPELPDLVIYQILLLLPTKFAVRASTLSRQWQRVWSSLPVLNLDEDTQLFDCQYGPERSKFHKYLRSCLKRFEKDNEHGLDIFRLRMRYSGGASIIDKWLSFSVEKNIKELDIILQRKDGDRSKSYYLPQTILNAKFLTTLRLENVKIKATTSHISLPSLKKLSLKNMELGNLEFVHLISGCPSIEYLSLISCGLCNCKLWSSSLKSLQVIMCRKVTIEVGAMNLESLRFWSDSSSVVYMHYSLKIAFCQSLRNLEFFNTVFGDQWFKDDSRFPLLESLMLYKCSNAWSDTIEINNQHLKRLEFCERDDAYTVKAKINTPNLAFFAFSTGYLPSDRLSALVSNFSVTAPNILEANINFFNFSERDFPLLRNFLKIFDCSRKISLSLNEAEALIFSEETKRTCFPPLPSLKHLEVAVDPSTEVKDDALIDSLKWMAPTLQSLYVNETEIFNCNS